MLAIASVEPLPYLLQPGWDPAERAIQRDEDPRARPSLEEVRQLLAQRASGVAVDSVGPIALHGYNESWEAEVSDSVRLVALSCFLGGGLLTFDPAGDLLASYRTTEIRTIDLIDLDCDGVMEIHTIQEDIRGTGLNVQMHHLYRVESGQPSDLWVGLDRGHVAVPGDKQDAMGAVTFVKSCTGSPEIQHVVRDLRTNKEIKRRWRVEKEQVVALEPAN